MDDLSILAIIYQFSQIEFLFQQNNSITKEYQYQTYLYHIQYINMMKSFSLAFFAALLATNVTGFSNTAIPSSNTSPETSNTCLSAHDANGMSRSAFVAGTLGALMLPSSALARGLKDANLKGAASDENARTCQDRCLYECLKSGTKTKEECGKACAETCSTAQGQLTSFTPGK